MFIGDEKSEKGGAVKNIVYITDDGFVLPTKVSILSIVRNVRDVRLAVHIVAVALSDENRQILQALETENVTIRLHGVPHLSDRLRLNHAYISDAALLKSRLQSILPDLDRALYVDGDTILQPGFLDIFDVDLSDVYAAVVMDMVRMRIDNWYKEFGLERYFNSGVMYLNFTKLREDDIAERFISHFQRDDIPKTFAEQDALNATFGGKVVFMGLQYNCLTAYRSRYSAEDVLTFFQARTEDYESPAILHFASSPKPWVMPIAQDTDIWLKYAPHEDYPEILQKYSVASKTLNVDSLKQRIASLNQKVETLSQKAESSKQKEESLKQKVESLKQKVESLKQKIESLNQKVESLNEGLDSRNASLVAKQERIDNLKAGIERRNVAIYSLKKRIAELEMAISERDCSISSQMNTMETLQSDKAALQGENEALQDKLDCCGKALDVKNAEFLATINSRNYRLGAAILALPRFLLRHLRACLHSKGS